MWVSNDKTEQSIVHHGDCAAMIPDTLEDGSVGCVVTDPPFGVDAQSNFASTERGQRYAQKIMNDSTLLDAMGVFVTAMEALEPKLADEAEMYVFTSWPVMDPWRVLLEELGWDVKMPLIWAKGWPGLGDLEANWGCGYEVIWYCKRGRRPVHHRRSAILEFDKAQPSQQLHPHEKPVGLLTELIQMSSNHGDIVVDPFAGSGSTIVAARDCGRVGVGFELDPAHYQTAMTRLSQSSLFG